MFCKSYCAAIYGVEAQIVQVEADVSDGLPVFHMVGFLGSEVKEASERVRSAIKNMGYSFKPKRITVNMSPADMRKEGTAFDLAISIVLMAAFGYIGDALFEKSMFIGELSLDGRVNEVIGVFPIVAAAKKHGLEYCFMPSGNLKEVSSVKGIKVIGVDRLSEVVDIIRENALEKHVCDFNKSIYGGRPFLNNEKTDSVFSRISGQKQLKRAAQIAAAGRHNMLIIGAPGTGKTMLAESLSEIMPPLDEAESLEVSSIASVCGDKEYMYGGDKRPFRAPHYSVSPAGLIGGGRSPMPGEITRAHKGVLFLDELTEFRKETLELLRLPIESKCVVHARSIRTISFPSDFMLVAAMNPCPCGYYPDMKRCRCSPSKIKKYLGKISHAFLDRMDIIIEAESTEYDSIESNDDYDEDEAAKIREEVIRTADIQRNRYKGIGISYNSELDTKGIKDWCRLDGESRELLSCIYKEWGLSARAYNRIIRVARTIADYDKSKEITSAHVSEAVFYRKAEFKLWNKKGDLLWN